MSEQSYKRSKMIEARKKMKLTQDELAKLTDVSRAYISNVERGVYAPSLQVAYRISKVLKKSIEEIFFNLNDRKANKDAA